jgi:osmoprotectant transport system permease protein
MTSQAKASTGPQGAARLLRYLAMPIFLGLACLALYLYVSSQQLDSIEKRILNADFLFARVIEHIELAVVSTIIVVVLAVTNIGQAVPSIGLLVLFAITWDFGFWPAIVALVAYSFLSILRNTMVGLQQVDRSTIEAARGMGMTKTAVLFRIELPLAVPIILAGIRTALIINVGTATLAAFVDAGGLGTVIDRGIRLGRDLVLVVGSVLTGVLALSIDWLAGVAEDILRPKGL